MSDETLASADREDLQDRLIDRGLREFLGGEAPPDLKQRILAAAAAGATRPATATPPVMASPRRGFRWGALAIAACLMIAAALLLRPAVRPDREAARRDGRANVADQAAPAAAGASASSPRDGTRDALDGHPRGAAEESETIWLADLPQQGAADDRAGVGAFYAATPGASAPLGPEAPAEDSFPDAGYGPAAGAADAPALMRGVGVNSDAGVPDGGYRVLPDRRYARLPQAQQAGVAAAPDDAFGLDWPSRGKRLTRDSEGRGPASGGDQYSPIVDNPFLPISAATTDNRLSTFSIDVDTASYANVRQFLMEGNRLPPPDAVRIEELVNYFEYDYAGPGESTEPIAWNAVMAQAQVDAATAPFAANIEVAACPWAPAHRLARIGIKGREVDRTQRPKSNLVFLVDVSGSMDEPNKLPLVLEGLQMLTRELGENDRIAIVVYASTEGLVLDSTRGDKQQEILDALGRLSAGGSTAGGAGIALAYKIAEQNFIKDGANRVILCTDGDFNVGVTSTADLQRLAEEKATNTGVFLTVLGFGRGNLNDAMMEAIADHGNGAYHYVDSRAEARKVLVEEMTGTLVTIAKDVKIQVEFNPAQVAGYRLIGYENRVLAAEDFNDDKKDAGEIGAGHTVTALYEIVPAGQQVDAAAVDALKYAPVAPAASGEAALAATGATDDSDSDARYAKEAAGASGELFTLKIRYKQPDGDASAKLEFPVTDAGQAFSKASADFQFASAVAGFGMLLRGSPYKGEATFGGILEIAAAASRDRDPHGYRREFVEMVERAKQLAGF
jgi:Ca-activated chloride channel family protein